MARPHQCTSAFRCFASVFSGGTMGTAARTEVHTISPKPQRISGEGNSPANREMAGLVLSSDPVAVGPLPPVATSRAGDRRTDVRTVEAMRSERDW
jgi:hypothetical protein